MMILRTTYYSLLFSMEHESPTYVQYISGLIEVNKSDLDQLNCQYEQLGRTLKDKEEILSKLKAYLANLTEANAVKNKGPDGLTQVRYVLKNYTGSRGLLVAEIHELLVLEYGEGAISGNMISRNLDKLLALDEAVQTNPGAARNRRYLPIRHNTVLITDITDEV